MITVHEYTPNTKKFYIVVSGAGDDIKTKQVPYEKSARRFRGKKT